MMNSTSIQKEGLRAWLIDLAGNIAASEKGLTLLARIKKLAVPNFGSTEEAMAWGSELNTEERETLVQIQRTSSESAQGEGNMQKKVGRATQSQLMREAAESFPSGPGEQPRRAVLSSTLPPNLNGSRN